MSFTILRGDARHLPLADGSIHCVVTSPPYYGLRSYSGVEPAEWPAVEYAPMGGLPPIIVPEMTCCLGLEPTPEAFVGHLVLVFREVKRVMRDDAVAWVNMGDSFNSSPSNQQSGSAHRPYHENNGTSRIKREIPSLKTKDLCMIPSRLALALQADGWYLRSDIIWAKGLSFCESYAGSCMPESVTDRPTSAHEHLFLLAKSARYFYDNEAVKEPCGDSMLSAASRSPRDDRQYKHDTETRMGKRSGNRVFSDVDSMARIAASGRNLRNVWAINPAGFAEAHFATFPPALVEPCIKAGTSERGCCPTCGAQWERVVERGLTAHDGDTESLYEKGSTANRLALLRQAARARGEEYNNGTRTIGWQPTCGCPEHEPIPCVVLDPFSGAGTTSLVADRLGRRGVGVELSDEYTRMARRRCYQDAPLLAYAKEQVCQLA